MKQTAVEWLMSQLEGDDSKIARVIGLKKYNSIIQQARAMEKEQSEYICVNVIEMILDESEQGKEINSKEIFEDVYNETFKSE